MMRSFYQAITGMNSMADGLSVSGNNIANAQTTGYKSRSAVFSDLMYQNMRTATRPDGSYAGRNPMSLGTGVQMSGISLDRGQGAIVPTGRKTDLAIDGEGYFILGDANGGDRKFTRDGGFELSRDSHLVTRNGDYVMGWNMDPLTGRVSTTSAVEPINIGLDQVSEPVETTRIAISGNLNAGSEIGEVTGSQLSVFDNLGTRHNVDFDFIKTSASPSEYAYIASAGGNFEASDSIRDVTFRPSEGIVDRVVKGRYEIATEDAGDGKVNITLIDPNGDEIVSQTINDSNQTVTLNDGGNSWFTVDYKSGETPSSAYFEIAETGTISFDSSGAIEEMRGSGPSGSPNINFTSLETGEEISVEVDISDLTGFSTENNIRVTESDGLPAATLNDFQIADNGIIFGIYDDGTTAEIGRVAVSTFDNPDGLEAIGENNFVETANSGDPLIGIAGEGGAGNMLSNTIEQSNVDMAKELTDLMIYHKGYTGNSKTIQITNQVLDISINLIR